MLDIEKSSEVQTDQDVIFNLLTDGEHEQVLFCYDKPTGLKAIIAVHSTVLGPSLGGTRIWNYQNDKEALIDVLRLSRGMTYKAAISGLNLGGGKAVIIGDASKIKSPAFWKRYGQFVESLGGRYITAEDVNTTVSDIEIVSSQTKHVSGLSIEKGGSGDPSPFTAYGVYLGMKATAKYRWGSDSLSGKKVSVQGTGKVGTGLIEYLLNDGVEVFVTDIFEDRVKALCGRLNAIAVGPEDIYDQDVDIYAPCALGATLNSSTIDRLKCSAVVGAANNQLENEEQHIQMLKEKDILYAPDFLVNAGGVINCYTELEGYNKQKALKNTEKIYDATLEIFNKSEKEAISTLKAAMQIAENRIEANKK
jgi:leucine dehydrogenase